MEVEEGVEDCHRGRLEEEHQLDPYLQGELVNNCGSAT